MSARKAWSFQDVDTATFATQFTSTLYIIAVVPSVGRFGGNALQLGLTGNGNAADVRCQFDDQPFWIVMFARQPNAIAANEVICTLYDGTTSQVDLRTDGVGTGLIFTRNGTQIGPAVTGIFSIGGYTHVALVATIHPSAGTVDVYVNGFLTAISLTGQNTRTSSNSTANTIAVQAVLSGAYICDLVVIDGQGSLNSWPGECRVDAIYPNTDSSPLQFTPSTGSSHFSLLDEAAPNGDADYVEDATVGHQELLEYQACPTSGTVIFLQHNQHARKTDAGLRQIASIIESGSSGILTGSTKTLGTSYSEEFEVYETDPDTSAAFLPAAVSAVKLGTEIIA